MLENDRKETVSKAAVMLIPHQSNVEKSTWRSHQYFVDFESGIHVEISTSNRCHNFHMDLPFRIEEISTNFPRRVSRSNRWQIYQPANSNISPLHHLAIICNCIGHDERLMTCKGWWWKPKAGFYIFLNMRSLIILACVDLQHLLISVLIFPNFSRTYNIIPVHILVAQGLKPLPSSNTNELGNSNRS